MKVVWSRRADCHHTCVLLVPWLFSTEVLFEMSITMGATSLVFLPNTFLNHLHQIIKTNNLDSFNKTLLASWKIWGSPVVVINMCKWGEQSLHQKVTGSFKEMENKKDTVTTLNLLLFQGLRETIPPKTSPAVLNHSTVYSRGRMQFEVAKHRIIQIPQPTPARTAAWAGKRETLYIMLMASLC